METTLLKGDRVFVDKTAYGIRMPVTLLSIPFTFDRFFGFKSYNELIQLNYKRLSTKPLERNDVVLFNNPLEIDKPLDKRSLALSRCVAIAGDTIRINGNDLYINGKKYIPSQDLLISYRFKKEKQDSIFSAMSMFDIPVRNSFQDSLWSYLSLNKYEMFILNQKLSHESQLSLEENAEVSYILIVPSKGLSIPLTAFNVRLYGTLIIQESAKEDSIEIGNCSIKKNGETLKNYEFNENYYWFMSDNTDNSIDSRTLGFVSERFIMGKASLIWFSSDKGGIKWDRIFTSIK